MATKSTTAATSPKKAKRVKRAPFEIGGVRVAAGTSAVVELPISLLFDHTPMTLAARVVHGRKPGPVLLVAAAVHGDEINGVEIIRRLMRRRGLSSLAGTLVAVPVVNTFGFINQSRYLPDRRDLNRSFPGSATGSLTSQLAHLFTAEILRKCTHGIDLHTGAIHRSNFPQIRANMVDPEVRAMAHAFGVPLLLNAKVRDGSLRGTAAGMNVPVIVYEAGEALRYDAMSIRAGYRGVVNVMRHLGMLPPEKKRHENIVPRAVQTIAQSSTWVRAPVGGLVRETVRLGSHVGEGDRLGIVSYPLGADEVAMTAEFAGIVIGKSNLPIVNQGDGLFNIARVADAEAVLDAVDIFRDDRESETIGSDE